MHKYVILKDSMTNDMIFYNNASNIDSFAYFVF